MLDLSTDEDRGRTVGTYQSLLQLGTLLGLVLSGFLTDLVGYRGTLAIYVPLAVLGLVAAVVVLRASDAEGAERPARPEVRAGRSEGTDADSTVATLRRLDPRLLVPAYVAFASLFTGSGVLMATLGVYLTHLAAEPDGGGLLVPVASLTGILLASRRLAGMIEAPIAGRLLDRFRDRRVVARVGVIKRTESTPRVRPSRAASQLDFLEQPAGFPECSRGRLRALRCLPQTHAEGGVRAEPGRVVGHVQGRARRRLHPAPGRQVPQR